MSFTTEQIASFFSVNAANLQVLTSFLNYLGHVDPAGNRMPYGMLVQVNSNEEGMEFLYQLEKALNSLMPEKQYELVHATEKVFLKHHLSAILKVPTQIFVLSDLFTGGSADYIYNEFRSMPRGIKIVIADTDTIHTRIKNNHELYEHMLPKHLCLNPASPDALGEQFLERFHRQFFTTQEFDQALRAYLSSVCDRVGHQSEGFLEALQMEILCRMNETLGVQAYLDGTDVGIEAIPESMYPAHRILTSADTQSIFSKSESIICSSGTPFHNAGAGASFSAGAHADGHGTEDAKKDVLARSGYFTAAISSCNLNGIDKTLLRLDHMIVSDSDGKRTIHYPQLVKWCVDHNLLQQAMTLYLERMPQYYAEQGILPEYFLKDTAGPLRTADAFYQTAFGKVFCRCDDSMEQFVTALNVFHSKNNAANLSVPAYLQLLKNTAGQIPALFPDGHEETDFADTSPANTDSRFTPACLRLADILEQYFVQRQKTPLYHTRLHYQSFCDFLKALKDYRNHADTFELIHFVALQDVDDYNRWRFYREPGHAFAQKLEAVSVAKEAQIPESRIVEKDQMKLSQILLYYLSIRLLENRMHHTLEKEESSDEKQTIRKINAHYLSSVKISGNYEEMVGLLNQALKFHEGLEPIKINNSETITE